jgi:hypothetical protein
MFEIDDELYYIDFLAIEKVLNMNNDSNPTGGLVKETETETFKGQGGEVISQKISEREFYRSKEVDGFRYQTIQNMLEIVLMEPIDSEEETVKKSGLDGRDSSFKMAWNTLIMYGIIAIYEPKTKK